MAEYIEREAAEKILYDGCHTSNGRECPDDVVELWHMVQAIPAADVQPVRHGRWVETTQPMGWDDVTCAECSECGEDFVLDEWGMEDIKNLMHYCPNCGCAMEDV